MKKTTLFFLFMVFACSLNLHAQTAPIVDSVATVIGITRTTAFSGCWVSSDGGAAITEKGICCSTSPSPTISDLKFAAYKISTPTYEPCVMAALLANTKYYVRAFATNSLGTSYSAEKEFTTSANDIESVWTCKANMDATATGAITSTPVVVTSMMSGAISYDQNSGTGFPATEIVWPAPTGLAKLSATSLTTAAFSSTVYTNFSITPTNTFNINRIVLSALGYKTGSMKIRIDYSFDNFATAGAALLNATFNTKTKTLTANGESSLSTANPLLTVEMGKENISYSPNITVAGGQTIYFRMYVWGKNASGIMLKNMIVSGKTSAVFSGTGEWSEAGRWSAGTVPTASDDVVIDGTASLITAATVGTLTVNAGREFSIAAGNKLTVNTALINNGTINLQSDATGTATILTPATISGSGSANVQQYLASGRNWYVSSPVAAATTSGLNSSTGSTMVSYDEVHGSTVPWVAESSTLNPAKGYVITSPVNLNPTITFSGTLNSGNKSIALTRTVGQTKEGFNLVGNPYPSHLTWTEALATAANTLSTIWYRTYSSSAYSFQTFNATGSIGSPIGVTGLIPPMQAFWVRSNIGGGTLTFKNAMRSHSETSNMLKSAEVSSNKLLRLQVSNKVYSDEAVVYFNANASDDFDAYDSPKMTNSSVAIPEICTQAGAENVVINGMNAVSDNLTLPLSFSTKQSNTFSIMATEFNNFEAGSKIILKDLLLNTETDLTDGDSYMFSSDIVDTSTRFALIFKSSSNTTGMVDQQRCSIKVLTNSNRQIEIQASDVLARNVMVHIYNTMGQELLKMKLTNSCTVVKKQFLPGIYLVTTKMNDQTTMNKVIIK